MSNIHALFLRAVRDGKTKAVKRHLSAGADINASFGSGSNALILIASKADLQNSHLDILKLLLEKGINTEYQNKDGETVYSRAEERGNHHLAELIRSFVQQKQLEEAIESCRIEDGLEF